MKILDVEKTKELIKAFPYVNESKVPYTYHHDYLREKLAGWQNMKSRSEIAAMTSPYLNDQRLWACCLAYLVDHLTAREVLCFSPPLLSNLSFRLMEADEVIEQYFIELENKSKE